MTGAVGYSDRVGNMKDDYNILNLHHELSEEEERSRRLIPLDTRRVVNPHVADLSNRDVQLLERERALIRILPREIYKDDDEYNMKLSYYAGSSLPIENIREEFDRIKPVIKRMGKVNRYTASAPSVPKDEDGLTQLEHELKILENDF